MSFKKKIIAIEGIDGSGKTTQANLLAEALKEIGHEVIQTHEPTNGAWGKKLRASATTGRLSLEDELEYFLKDRQEHVKELILPTTKRGGIVILDRYYFSNMAYQGARGLSPEKIRCENEKFAPVPDLLIILDLDVDIALERIGVRDGKANEFEKKEPLQLCRNIFLSLNDEPFVHVVDAHQDIDKVHQTILNLCGL